MSSTKNLPQQPHTLIYSNFWLRLNASKPRYKLQGELSLSSHEQKFIEIVSGKRTGLAAGLTRCLLRMAEVPYALGSTYKNWRYDCSQKLVQKASVPVISVGNLTTGGTGKTPMVAWVCRWLRQQGVRVCIISRGYGAEKGDVNDEAIELEQRLPDVPHLQNPDRVAAAQVATEELDCQVIVLDDAFQHRRIYRDLDIVLIDAANPFGYGHQLPRGLLRESLRGLKRADAVVLTRSDMIDCSQIEAIKKKVARYHSPAIWVESIHQPKELVQADGSAREIASLRGKRVAAFCGIGNPAGLQHTLESCGYELAGLHTFPDHHHYSRSSIQLLADWCRELTNVEALVCTHKDLVKIGTNKIGTVPMFALTIGMKMLVGEELLEQLLADKLAEILANSD